MTILRRRLAPPTGTASHLHATLRKLLLTSITLMLISNLTASAAENQDRAGHTEQVVMEPGSLIQPLSSVIIRTDHWLAEFAPERGAQLLRLRHLPTSRDILHYPRTPELFREQPERHGIPVLFPPNRIDSGQFTWHGRTYTFPINDSLYGHHIHGIVLNVPWETSLADTGSQAPSITFSFLHNESRPTFAGYPHRFRLMITYRFYPDSVRSSIHLENLDAEGCLPMPFGLGFHTAFNIPLTSQSHPIIRVTAADYYWEINPVHRLPTGKQIPWASDEHFHLPGGQTLDPQQQVNRHTPAVTATVDGRPFRGAILDFPDEDLRVTYEVGDDFQHWYLWRPPDDPSALCIEPMTWMANAPNMKLPPETTGLRQLDPGKTWETWTLLSVASIPVSSPPKK